jgi:hypothetical protein
MKRIVLLVCIAFAGEAWAQKPAAEPAKPMAAPEASKPAVQAAAKPRKPNPKRGEDARHCLELPNSTDVIKCAEEYL